MRENVQHSPNPVAFATGGGSQSGKESLTFSGSKILSDGEEVYVLEECPPAQSRSLGAATPRDCFGNERMDDVVWTLLGSVCCTA